MKFIGKLLIYLLVALLIVVLAFYFLLRPAGAHRAGQRLDHGEYRLRAQL